MDGQEENNENRNSKGNDGNRATRGFGSTSFPTPLNTEGELIVKADPAARSMLRRYV
jgi:hypothetical protein